MPLLISACLLGEPCRFDGQGKYNSELLDLLQDKTLIPVCPEVEGGLPVPRPPAEIRGKQVFRENGEEVSSQFIKGAEICRDKGIAEKANLAILKSRSPACGCGQVYDGTFSKRLKAGDGVLTQALKAAGIKCISDEQYLKENH
ncbi:MAG: DUF523 domain-containing protein [Candidatus Marinimicrobia bacterium]|nr:DUF523 domain-containing protein [Candidatus Neomarinimicrobiota bacterium]MCF7923373.1 DUF523 domain-containing protein [Candidatus Neomarinimicrobiota bacterium]